MKIEVYTDGSATVATKPGGWGFVVVLDGVKHHEGSGSMEKATNNDAELQAAVEGLKSVLLMRVKEPEKYGQAEVTLVSDSEIVLGWTNGTYRFKQKAKMATYEILKSIASRLRVHTRWVEGHTGDVHNERCDELANIARKSLLPPKPEKVKTKKVSQVSIEPDSRTFNIWHNGILKVIDLERNIVENHNEEKHGPKSSRLEFK